MSNRASAARYARALFDVALKEADPEQVERDLAAFGQIVKQHDDLRKAFANPAVPVSAKKGVIERLLALGPIAPPVAKLLALLAERDRLELLPDLVASYRARLEDHLKIVRAEITTAEALPAERAAQLQQRLAKATGRTVTMTTRVDPAIIGGVVTRIGDKVYDGSLATQLAKVRERLLAER